MMSFFFSPGAADGRSLCADDLALPTPASTLDALFQLVASGIGIACVLSFYATQQIANGPVVSVLREYVDHNEVVRAIWPSSQYQSQKLRAFVDFLAGSVLQSSMEVTFWNESKRKIITGINQKNL